MLVVLVVSIGDRDDLRFAVAALASHQKMIPHPIGIPSCRARQMIWIFSAA